MNSSESKKIAMVIGVSAGGVEALNTLLPFLPANCQIPVVIVLHIGKHQPLHIISHLNNICHVEVKEADCDEKLRPGVVYFAPPNYHLLIEPNYTFALSLEEEVNYSRPSIDVLFESAADVFRKELIGVILTGANNDGALGMQAIQRKGGLTVVQDPATAFAREMPQATLRLITPNYILSLGELTGFMQSVNELTKPFLTDKPNGFPCTGFI